MASGSSVHRFSQYLVRFAAALAALTPICVLPAVYAQSPEASAEWALFDQILLIGIVVGMVVFGIMFYAIIRYRERPQGTGTE